MKLFKNFITITVLCISFLTVPLNTMGKMFAETFIVSGSIVNIRDNMITLENGYSYIPAKQNMVINVSVGQMVTIRYVIDNEEEKRYSTVVPGKGGLKSTPTPKEHQKTKK